MRKRAKKKTVEPVDEPLVTGDVMTLMCVRQAPNPRWVICDMDGNQIKVAISPRYTNKLVGKLIKVARVSRGLLEDYEHLP